MNGILTSLFSAVMSPMRSLDPAISLTIISLVVGGLMLVGFKYTSNQRALSRAKGKALSQLLAIRLFKDDPWLTIRCLGGAIRDNFGYLRYMLFPFVVMFIPVVLLLVQMEQWYGHRPLDVGASTNVAVGVEGDVKKVGRVRLLPSTDGAYEVETDPLRIASLGEVNWRVRPTKAGEHELKFEVDGKPATKTFSVTDGESKALGIVSVKRIGTGFFDALLYPAEPTIGGDPAITSISVQHDERPFSILGFEMPWWLAFFILTIVFAFILRRPLGVDF